MSEEETVCMECPVHISGTELAGLFNYTYSKKVSKAVILDFIANLNEDDYNVIAQFVKDNP